MNSRQRTQIKCFFSGSTPERTRLYRMAISLNIEELEADFGIFGVNFNETGEKTGRA